MRNTGDDDPKAVSNSPLPLPDPSLERFCLLICAMLMEALSLYQGRLEASVRNKVSLE